jgi:hypothetical protein
MLFLKSVTSLSGKFHAKTRTAAFANDSTILTCAQASLGLLSLMLVVPLPLFSSGTMALRLPTPSRCEESMDGWKNESSRLIGKYNFLSTSIYALASKSSFPSKSVRSLYP